LIGRVCLPIEHQDRYIDITVHGLHERPGDAKQVLVISTGQNRETRFFAGAPET
jgi:hypothetical protein